MIRARSDGPEWKSAPLKLPRTEADRRETVTKLGTKNYGGESGIRTHGRISPTHAFQACSLNRSDISPPCLGVSSVTNRRRGGKRTGVAQEFLVRAGGNKSATGLLHFCTLFRGSAIGSTPAFGAGYPGSSPGPGANLSFLFNHLKQAL